MGASIVVLVTGSRVTLVSRSKNRFAFTTAIPVMTDNRAVIFDVRAVRLASGVSVSGLRQFSAERVTLSMLPSNVDRSNSFRGT